MQCRGRQRTWEAGFTLTELMVALGVFLLLFGGIYLVMLAGQRSYYIGEARIQVDQEARRALDAVSKELRSASKGSLIFADGNANGLLEPGDTLTFSVVTGMAGGIQLLSAPAQYTVGGLNNRQLLRTQNGVTAVVANNVQQFSVLMTPPIGTPSYATLGITTQQMALTGHSLNEGLQSQVAFRN